MKFMVNGETVAVTEARGTAEDPTICFRILKAIAEIGDKAMVTVFGEDGNLIKKMSGAEFRDYANWAFYGGCPRFCPNPSLAA